MIFFFFSKFKFGAKWVGSKQEPISARGLATYCDKSAIVSHNTMNNAWNRAFIIHHYGNTTTANRKRAPQCKRIWINIIIKGRFFFFFFFFWLSCQEGGGGIIFITCEIKCLSIVTRGLWLLVSHPPRGVNWSLVTPPFPTRGTLWRH